MDNKISRRGFLTLIFGGIAVLFVAQLPGAKALARKQEGSGYDNDAYGGR